MTRPAHPRAGPRGAGGPDEVRFCTEHNLAAGEPPAGSGARRIRNVLIRWPKARWRRSSRIAADMDAATGTTIEAVVAAGWRADLDRPQGRGRGRRARLRPSGRVGLEDALDAQIAEYEALLAEVKDRNAAIIPDLEWAFLGTGDDFLPHMHDAERFPTVAYNTVLRDLGPTPSAAMVEPTRNGLGFDESFGYAPVSPEVAPDHAADPILVGRYDTLPIGDDLRPALAFTAAGRNGQAFRVDSDIWTSHLVQAERTVLRRIDEILGAGGRNLSDLAAPPAE